MKSVWMAGLILTAGTAFAAAPAAKPVAAVDLTDPAGDVQDQNGPGNDRDVVKLSLGSDGTSVLVTATLAADEHGSMAGSVVDLYIDADDSVKTGGTAFWGKEAQPPKGGYDYLDRLSVCMAWDENIGSCAGGPDVPPKSRHARVSIDQFNGAPGKELDMTNSTTLISGMGPAGAPFSGRVLQGKIPYATLDAKPGQVLRIAAREAGVAGLESFFPDVLLALK